MKPLTLDKAVVMAKAIASARRKWGRQANPPYTIEQISEALQILDDAGLLAPAKYTEEDITKLKRQIGAAKSRAIRLLKQHGVSVDEYRDDDHATEESAE